MEDTNISKIFCKLAAIKIWLKPFSDISSNHSIGPKQSQKLRKATKLSPQWIAATAKSIEKEEITLPELDLPSNDDYISIWALVDSGSAVQAASSVSLHSGP